MKSLDYNKIEKYKNEAFNFDIGKYFSQAIEVFQNNWVPFVIYTLISGIIFLFSYFTIIGLFFITFPLMIGFLVGAERAEQKMSLDLGDFFGSFKNLGNYFIFSLIMIGATIVVFLPFIFLTVFPLFFNDSENLNPALMFGSSMLSILYMFVIIIFLFIFQILLYFTPFLIHYGNMKTNEAMKTSIALAKKNFWWILLIQILVSIISSIGIYLCGIGALATYPIAYIFTYFLLNDMILTDDTQSEIDLLGTNQE